MNNTVININFQRVLGARGNYEKTASFLGISARHLRDLRAGRFIDMPQSRRRVVLAGQLVLARRVLQLAVDRGVISRGDLAKLTRDADDSLRSLYKQYQHS